LADPMCGSGTFAIEAAMMAADAAPGLRRAFAFERWPDFDAARWKALREEARDRRKPSLPAPIYASDRHAGALSLARRDARAAGVEGLITFGRADISKFAPDPPPRLFVLNPPYGERLKDPDLPELYRSIGTALRRFPGASAWVLSGNRDLTRFLGFKSSRQLDLLNGDITCRLLKYEVFGADRS
jgi:putative N6-adenine-specific DNA methylase